LSFTSLYVHIPFCLSKCNYCDFISFPADLQDKRFGEYLKLLKKELLLRTEKKKDLLGGLSTIYFGGGTPSLLAAEDLAVFLRFVLALANDPQAQRIEEITIEVNPATVDLEKLTLLRQAGFNRISIGVQSFSDPMLEQMGRRHTAGDGKKTVALAKEAGFDNISLDLIYSLPEQDMQNWHDQLQTAVALDCQHISLYGLTLSAETVWGIAHEHGRLILPDEDLCADMQQFASQFFQDNGYVHYEIANYAKQGYHSRHNCAYWQRCYYLGIGVNASSCYGNVRWRNFDTLKDYENAVCNGISTIAQEEHLTEEQVLSESVFLGLRMMRGIAIKEWNARYQCDLEQYFFDAITQNIKRGLLQEADETLSLTEKGIPLANEVFVDFV